MKRITKAILIGVCAGVLAAVAQLAFHLERGVILGVLIAAAVAFVAGTYLYSFFCFRRIRRTLVLLEEDRVEEFIAESLRLREKTRLKGMRNNLEINLSAAYFRSGQYDKAIVILQNLAHSQLQPQMEIVRRLNLCMSYFYAGQEAQAMQLYQDSQPLFRTPQSQDLAGNLAALDVLAALTSGELDRAGQLLKQAQEKWKNPRLQQIFSELERRLYAKRQD